MEKEPRGQKFDENQVQIITNGDIKYEGTLY